MRLLALSLLLLACATCTLGIAGRRPLFTGTTRHWASRVQRSRNRLIQLRGGAAAERTDVVNRFGPLGNIEQIDYAQAAVDRSSAVAAVASKHESAVLFGWLQQKDELLDEGVPLPRLIRLSPTLAAITTGLQGDCRLVQRYMVEDVAEFCSIFVMDPDADYVANSLARRLQDRTMASQRPLATHVLVGSVHSSQPAQLFSVTLAGQATQVKAYCAGQGQEHGLKALQQAFQARSNEGINDNSSDGEEEKGAERLLQDTVQAMSRNASSTAGVAYEMQRFTLKLQT